MIKKQEKVWRERIEGFVEKDLLPDRWMSVTQLADWVMQIDPYLLNSTPAHLSQLFGNRANGQVVLPLATAKRYMLTEDWIREAGARLQTTLGDELSRIGKKSLMKLEEGIDDGKTECIQIGLEMAGLWSKSLKLIRSGGGSERIKELTRKAWEFKRKTGADVISIKNNH